MPESIIPSDAVKAIQDSVATDTIAVSGNTYTTRPVHLPPREPVAASIEVHTLTGLVDYCKAERDTDEAPLIHVVNPVRVEVISSLQGRYQDRTTYLVANCKPIIGDGFKFGFYLDLEQFVVNLQSQFEPTEQRATILQVVGNIKHENVKTMSDDGVTQQVVTRAGIERSSNAQVPNPVELKPYRTFPEIAQPESEFVLRLKQSSKEGELPTAALFEADGGKWKLDAIKAIRDYLAAELEGFTIVA